jgi:hypothetical protein
VLAVIGLVKPFFILHLIEKNMKTEMSMLSIDLWEAWVDCNPSDGDSTAMLYVIGDVYVGKSKQSPVLKKRDDQGYDPAHLFLEIVPCILEDNGRVAEVTYAEPLHNGHSYDCISIWLGEDIVAEIEEIEWVR